MIDYLDTVTNAATLEDVWECHCDAMAAFGFDRLIYGFTRYRTNTSLGDPQDFVLLTNHDPAYVDVYLKDGLYFNAPMVKWALENEGACSWSWMARQMAGGALTPQQQKVLAFNQKMEVRAGYTISFKSVVARSKGAIALCANRDLSQEDVDATWAKHGREIVAMNNVAHLKILTLPYTSARPLTKRQREVLELVGDGKTTADIALILGLTAATVEKHLRLAREAMDVDTTAQAILKAAFQNQMFVLDPEPA